MLGTIMANGSNPGKLIRLIRLVDFDATQNELAASLSIAKNTVSLWERNQIPRTWRPLALLLRGTDPERREQLIEAIIQQGEEL